ncbi:MAG: T9SS type A sorting domain-containing protein [Ignavibacteria bacterium]|nr:T9SS type A sorting domain-containing protein [Ignavibacteria bacterium]
MKNITLAILLLLVTGITFSQSKTAGTITETPYIAPDGNLNYSPKTISHELQSLSSELKKAKNSGDINKILFYQHQINTLAGNKQANITNITDRAVYQSCSKSGNETDNFNFTAINSTHAVNSGAISTDRVSGKLYAAYTRSIVGASDEMYFYKSTNNGLTWAEIHHFSIPSFPGLEYRQNELDIEVISKGDSAYIWGTAGANLSSGVSSMMVFKVREDGNLFNVGVLEDATSTFGYRFPRVTSDNARYTTGSYIYFMFTQDSIAGGNRFAQSKLYLVPNPFTPEPDFTRVSNNPNGSYFYFTSNPGGDSVTMQNDICYVNTPGDSDLVVTTTLVRGHFSFNGQSIFLTTSSNYGSGVDYSYSINDTRYLQMPRIASPGYQSRNVMVSARRLFANGDWDPYYYYARNYSRNAATYSQSGFLNNTADTTLTVDLKARYRSFDNFLFAFSNRSGADGKAVVAGVPFKSGAFQPAYIANPPGTFGTGSWGAPVAGFRNTNNDSCIIGWGSYTGFGYNVTGGQSGTMTGTGNNSSVAGDFSLEQNYPNPFNPSTKISFTIQQNSFAKLTVFDIMGREISTLVNGQLTAGTHSIDFNASAFPSGVYYYKLEANGFSDVKKMMLVK